VLDTRLHPMIIEARLVRHEAAGVAILLERPRTSEAEQHFFSHFRGHRVDKVPLPDKSNGKVTGIDVLPLGENIIHSGALKPHAPT
jgi:hypothetical protein